MNLMIIATKDCSHCTNLSMEPQKPMPPKFSLETDPADVLHNVEAELSTLGPGPGPGK